MSWYPAAFASVQLAKTRPLTVATVVVVVARVGVVAASAVVVVVGGCVVVEAGALLVVVLGAAVVVGVEMPALTDPFDFSAPPFWQPVSAMTATRAAGAAT